MAINATYVSTTTFTVATNLTADFMAGRRIKADCGSDGYKYGTILSSSYSSPNTTVILTAASNDLTPNLVSVEYGIVGKGSDQSMPEHIHDSGEGAGGTIDHGILTGKNDDDHTQYHNNTRGDVRYYTQSQVDALTWTESDITDLDKYTQAEVDTISGSLDTKIDTKGDMNDVIDDTTPQLGGDLDTNQKSFILQPIPTNNQEANGSIATMQVDANAIGFGGALHMDTDGNWVDATASGIATMPCRALALETGTGSKKVLLRGFIRDDSWDWNVSGDIYMSTTPGTLTQVAPSNSGEQVQLIGYATHADRIFFNPNVAMAEI